MGYRKTLPLYRLLLRRATTDRFCDNVLGIASTCIYNMWLNGPALLSRRLESEYGFDWALSHTARLVRKMNYNPCVIFSTT